MNDEIKEILDNIKNKYEDYYVQDIVSGNGLKLLLDHITNLQQKYEEADYDRHKLFEEKVRLKELNAELKAITKRPTPIDYAMIQKRYEDYKSRCEKAIEYCKSYSYWEDEDGTFHETDFCIDELLNILQNGSDDNE